MPLYVTLAASKMSGSASPYWHFLVMKKSKSRGAQYVAPIFKDGVQVAGVCHVIECTHSHSDLQIDDRNRLAGWAGIMASNKGRLHYEWEQNEWSSQAGTMLHHQRQDVRYCFSLLGLHVMIEFQLQCTQYSWPIFKRKTQFKDGTRRSQSQS